MEELIHKQEIFIKTLAALHRSIIQQCRTDLDEGSRIASETSVIKHFEMCYEASWKFLQTYLFYHHKFTANSPRGAFKACFEFNILDKSVIKKLLTMVNTRNSTIHRYDQEDALEICQDIGNYYEALKMLATLPSQK